MRDIEKYASDYNQPNFEDYQLKYRRKKILEILEQYQPISILEIGCGMEPLFKYYDKYKKYTLVEPGQIFYENAKKLSCENNRITCYHEFFGSSELELKDDYDLIICSSLLHEMDDPDAFAESINAVCSEKTTVHVNVPNARSFHRLLATEMGLIKSEHDMSERNILYQQHMVFDIELLKKLFIKHNFRIVEEGSYFVKPFTHDQMYKMMQNNIIDENVLDGLYKMEKYMTGLGSEIFINCCLNA